MTIGDATTIARDVQTGKQTASAVTEACLARIAADNPALNALVGLDPDWARDQARKVDERVRTGEQLSLAGVPLVVKDNIWIQGRRISQGSRLFDDFIAPTDAIAIERARAAGAVIIGIGNCPEFACKGQTNSPLHGIARNPVAQRLTPGGSSGGNAAALAAGIAPVALGTDGGGSGRRPSAHTGTVGFKPSFGAIPYGPGFPEPFWGIAVIAPMARTVVDTELLFKVVAGLDPRDPDTISIIPTSGTPSAAQVRVAFSPRLGLDVPVDPDVSEAISVAVETLRRAGWDITNDDPAWPKGLQESDLMPLQMAGLAALHGAAFQRDRNSFDSDVALQIERGLAMTGAEVANALEAGLLIRRSLATFLTRYDLLFCPTTPCVAWSADLLGPSHIGGVAVTPRGHAVFTPFFNHALAPAISLPCGRGRGGLPVGLQMAARRGADFQLLCAAAEVERALMVLNA